MPKKGNAVVAIPCSDALFYTEDKIESTKQISRGLVVRIQAPHVFYFGDLYNMHIEAQEKDITNSVVSPTLALEL